MSLSEVYDTAVNDGEKLLLGRVQKWCDDQINPLLEQHDAAVLAYASLTRQYQTASADLQVKITALARAHQDLAAALAQRELDRARIADLLQQIRELTPRPTDPSLGWRQVTDQTVGPLTTTGRQVLRGNIVVDREISKVDIWGTVHLKPGGYLRDFRIYGPTNATARTQIVWAPGAVGAKMEDGSITLATPNPYVNGFNGSGYTARRVDVRGTSDGGVISGNDTTWELGWIRDTYHDPTDPNWGGKPSHDDAIQCQSGLRNRILGMRLEPDPAANSALQLTQDVGLLDVEVGWSYVEGGKSWPINFSDRLDLRNRAIKAHLHDIDFGPVCSGRRQGVVMSDAAKALATISNLLYSDGTPVVIKRGA